MSYKPVKTKQAIISGAVFLCVMSSCQNRENQLQEGGFWKYSDGFYIGDILDFNKPLNRFHKDTIYQNDIPKAILVNIETRILSGDKRLHIKDPVTSNTGIYVSK
ncbi:hypothetical protein [Empedobacter brevis]|uniref:hypothetical protein n=1 Tax=Empedobacter brevis TaxID=247 RepID=UPI0028A78215|nr:hypothetical protein [Empedobacter brevis]